MFFQVKLKTMKTRLFIILLAWSFFGPLMSIAQVKIIFDTDFGGDADDLGALVMLHNFMDQSTPLYVGFKHFSEHAPWMKMRYEGEILDNSTFDQTAVLYAVRQGIGNYWDRIEGGYCLADERGGNKWIEKDPSNHSYLKLIKNPEEMANLIESIMLNQF